MNTTFRKLTPAWPLAIFLLLPALTRAETAVQAWVQRFNGPANGWDTAYAAVVDSSNNVIVTGYAGSDYATVKYSGSGEPLWTNIYDVQLGFASNPHTTLVVSGSNDVIVTGWINESGGNHVYGTVKYSSAGVPLWTNRYNGPGHADDSANAVAVDGTDNVIVTGASTGSGSGYDYATLKYSSAGMPLWTNRYNGPGNSGDNALALAVDGSNNVIVTGLSTGIGSGYDYATFKYSSAGVPLWTNRYNGPGNASDWAGALAVDGSNNVIVTGLSTGIGSGYDYATLKYSSAGVPLWTNRYNGPGNASDWAGALAVDGSDNVIVTGCSANANLYPYNYDYVTIKYSSAGVPLWTNRYNGPGNGDDWTYAVAVDGRDNVIVTGYSANANLYPYNYDYLTIKYSAAGVPLWTNRYNGPANGNDEACAVAVDRSGNVIVTGTSTGSDGSTDFVTIKYICVPSPVVTGLQLSNGTFQLQVDEVLQPGTLVIEACTNLLDWSPVFTNTAPTNVLFYTEPDAGNSPARFYRAFQFP